MSDSLPGVESIQSRIISSLLKLTQMLSGVVWIHPESDCWVLTCLKKRTKAENTPAFHSNALNAPYEIISSVPSDISRLFLLLFFPSVIHTTFFM